MGYWCIAREFDASEHGSYPNRCRWCAQALLHVPDDSGALVRLYQETMMATDLHPREPENFLEVPGRPRHRAVISVHVKQLLLSVLLLVRTVVAVVLDTHNATITQRELAALDE